MKKFKGYMITFLAGALFATAGSAFAANGLQKVEAYLRPSLPVTLNGEKIQLEYPPVMYDGSTYLKLRDVSKLTGLIVNWNEKTETVELSGKQQTVSTNQSGNLNFFYSFEEYNQKNDQKLTSSVVNNKIVVTYNGDKYETDPNLNYFYDSKTGYTYYSKDFFLQFLPDENLNGLHKYSIDYKQKMATIIE
jgi:hypothetical protein